MSRIQRKIKLTIEYDGSNYCGWQIQKNGLAIQEVVAKALSRISGRKVNLQGASRTDSGVHAKGQTAHFLTSSRMTPEQFVLALNARLPDDIAVRKAEPVRKSFHARFQAKNKSYRYTILNSRIRTALDRNFYYLAPYRLSLGQMKKASRYLIGQHDFRAFASQSSDKEDCRRRIYSIKISKKGGRIYIDITGNGFLYNMVRTIVGTLLQIGRGKIKPEYIKEILESRERKKAGPTAPAKGLCLIKVNY